MIAVKWATPSGVIITSPAHFKHPKDALFYANALKGWPVAVDVWVELDGVRLKHVRPSSAPCCELSASHTRQNKHEFDQKSQCNGTHEG